MREVLREATSRVIEELGDHALGCVIMGGYARGRPGDIDIVVVVDGKESVGAVRELQDKMGGEYDLHPMTLETFESKLFLSP